MRSHPVGAVRSEARGRPGPQFLLADLGWRVGGPVMRREVSRLSEVLWGVPRLNLVIGAIDGKVVEFLKWLYCVHLVQVVL